MLSIAMLTVHESLEELKIAGCINSFTFSEYLIVAHALDVQDDAILLPALHSGWPCLINGYSTLQVGFLFIKLLRIVCEVCYTYF